MCSGIIDRQTADDIEKQIKEEKKQIELSKKGLIPHRIETKDPSSPPTFSPKDPPFLAQKNQCPRIEKIVFLNDENLAVLKGYKAAVSIQAGLQDRFEIHVVITGFKLKTADALLFELKALPANEIKGI